LIKSKNPENKTYSKLPIELTKAISEEFEDTFKKSGFRTFAHVYLNEIVLRVGHSPKSSIKQVNFDLTSEIEPQGEEPIQILERLIDCAKELFQSYFEHNDIEKFSPSWAKVANTNIDYKFDGTNTDLEDDANKLLGEDFENVENLAETTDSKMIVGDFSELIEIEKIVETLKRTKSH